MTLADKGYQCRDTRRRRQYPHPVQTPPPPAAPLSRRQRIVNRSHARLRGIGERAMATLKGWKILIKLRCCPRRASAIVQAILVLHPTETGHHPG
jgi:hypothetical protein